MAFRFFRITFAILFSLVGVVAISWQAQAGEVWQPPEGLKQIPIWPNGAPDMKGVSLPPESLKPGKQTILNVSEPTMTVFPPKGKNTGVAMVVFPGGGFRILAMDVEGTELCDWITAKGITCVLSKYRIPGTADYWDPQCKCRITPKVSFALQDAQRTIRLVRARAKELDINPQKIGVLGMSSGGYLVAETSNIFKPAYKPVDAIDNISSRPDFAIALYPGHMCEDGKLRKTMPSVSKDAPPTFLLQSWQDPVDDVCNSLVYARALYDAGVNSEVHIFAKGGHAFGVRKTDQPITKWPALAEGWLTEIGMLP
ncbi:alpha/beta hydrolase [Rhizobium oryziradicis]|uniref:Xylanase n=1 Tax=Rhizobium oryziradicis TaxID=1867956 RepID=A0A1Q8ZRQ1_9HYPH|nr:alpha/beta hydrolase [Rhizobium oryziradicis]OLP44668.1 xylanase [Rhizobium oryziradicis]